MTNLNKTVKISSTVLLTTVFLLCLQVFAQSITILQPKDKIITHKDRLLIRGKTSSVNEITINGLKVGIRPDGMFSAGMLLHPGKNLLVIKANKDGSEIVKKARVLRVIKFIDMEKKYKGKLHWARHDVISMATLGIVEGYPDGNFKPKKRISREELATWISRSKDLIVKDLIKDVFFDVPKEHWRAPFVGAVINKGYMKGSSSTAFGMGYDIKRGEAANIIDKVEGIQIPVNIKKSPFSDVPLNHPYSEAIYVAFYNKMVKGVSRYKKIYQPNREMNRAESTMLLSRIKNVKDRLKMLYDFSKGYDPSKYSKINTAPIVKSIIIAPLDISAGSGVLLSFTAKVMDLQGSSDISEVKIDLMPIGGPSNALMYDNGTHGDEKAKDGIYSLKVILPSGATKGIKTLKIFASDKNSWVGSEKIKFNIN